MGRSARHPMIELVIPAELFPGALVNVNNERGQTRYIAHRRAPWRSLGKVLAHRQRVEAPVTITALFRWPDNRIRDTSNWFPTVKALVDGVVSAGALVADDDNHVEWTAFVRERPNGPQRITLRIESVKR